MYNNGNHTIKIQKKICHEALQCIVDYLDKHQMETLHSSTQIIIAQVMTIAL